ncbi:MAG: stage III sporulation protein AB [Eubacteriales bacterium]|nr:stage III sporulation protein AB [Eubacteriales bacterium]
MIHILGAIFIVGACGVVGLEQSYRLRARVRVLTALIDALNRLHGGIVQNLRPLPELIEILADEAPQQVRPFFSVLCGQLDKLGEKPFFVLWRAAAEESCEKLYLREKETEALIEPGRVLGGDLKAQDRALTLCLERMKEYRSEAYAELRERSRLYTVLGFSGGLLFVIILL